MKQDLHSSAWKCCALSLLFASLFVSSFAQITESSSHYEAGITVGPSNFLGDLGGNQGKGTPFIKDNNIPMTKLAFGAFISYHPSELLAIRFGVNVGSLEGDDAIIKNKGGLENARKIRNSDFKSKFVDGLLMAEIYPTTLLEYDQSDVYHRLRPYVAGGIGVFHFNPMGKDPFTGDYVALRGLHTEGQGFAEYPARKEYKLTQLNIPLGIGVKYFLSENVNIAFEIIHRKTFTDYIDDVSTTYVDPSVFYAHMPLAQAQLAERMANKSGPVGSPVYQAGSKRGTSTNNDSYYTAGFKLGVRLGGNDRLRNSTSCPVRF
ncbi:MAG: outer membrane beta-barrel protein [Chitinophagaceae bacterium]|nr:outer membrane beta-barrel protein [Chitinophagaceae bacterium]